MREAGLKVCDCSHASKSIFRYILGFIKFLRYKRTCDIIFIGFLGQFIVPFIKLLTKKPIVFDAFVSVYQTMVFDRNKFKKDSLPAKVAKCIDRLSCRLADKVFLDTNRHIDYFVDEFGLSRRKFARILVGSDDRVMYPRPFIHNSNKDFLVHFHGEFQKLHGTDVIIEAAKLLPEVKFRMIGKGKGFLSSRNFAADEKITNIEFVDAVSYEVLPDYISTADICLGIFGGSQKTNLVIPHKVYESIACAKPVISADTRAARELFTHKINIYFCRAANSKSLAEAIMELKENEDLRYRLSRNGHQTFISQCSSLVLGKKINEIMDSLLVEKGT